MQSIAPIGVGRNGNLPVKDDRWTMIYVKRQMPSFSEWIPLWVFAREKTVTFDPKSGDRWVSTNYASALFDVWLLNTSAAIVAVADTKWAAMDLCSKIVVLK